MVRVSQHVKDFNYLSEYMAPPRKSDKFLTTIQYIFKMTSWFGIPTFGGKAALVWTFILLLMMFAIEFGAILKVVLALTGMLTSATGDRNVTSQLSGALFYGNALLSLLLTWRFMYQWKDLSLHWARAENTPGIYFPPDVTLRRKVILVSIVVAVCALVEHIMSMIAATGLKCPIEEYFQRYILSSHGFLLHPKDYNLWFAIPIFIMSKMATILWNFQDLVIILISMGLTSRYQRLNSYVKGVVHQDTHDRDIGKTSSEMYIEIQTWRKLREAYVQQASLVRRVDKTIGALVLLSNSNNFYFICLQLFLIINKQQGPLINQIYYAMSLIWLIFRACSVVLAAADVNVHSQRALSTLSATPRRAYNVEIRRLENQLAHDIVALGGMGYFSLYRQILLEVAANIIKYELVLLQFDQGK